MTHRIEIIAIGNELLKGITVNTNAAEIGHALFNHGYFCCRQIVLPDDSAEIKKQLQLSLSQESIVIATGGLGPTCDDITRQVAAEVFDSDFTYSESLASELKQRYGSLPISLQNQATVPSKASLIKNSLGTAPGLIFNNEKGTLILMPGVPKEMRAMLLEQLIPYLQKTFPIANPPIDRNLHFFGISESSIDPTLRKLETDHPNMEFGIYPSNGLISVHLSLKSPINQNIEEIESCLNVLKTEFKDNFYSDSSEKIEVAIQNLFMQHKWTLSTAESCTGGAVSARLTRNAGASNYFLGGVVSYANSLKEELLNVDRKIIDHDGAVNEETVRAMSLGAIKLLKSDFAVAISGIAGPAGGSVSKPIGTVWIAVAKKGGAVHCFKIHAHGNREMIIERSVNAALGELYSFAKKDPLSSGL